MRNPTILLRGLGFLLVSALACAPPGGAARPDVREGEPPLFDTREMGRLPVDAREFRPGPLDTEIPRPETPDLADDGKAEPADLIQDQRTQPADLVDESRPDAADLVKDQMPPPGEVAEQSDEMVLNLLDFGADPANNGKNDAPALRAVAEAVSYRDPDSPPLTVIYPEGHYYIGEYQDGSDDDPENISFVNAHNVKLVGCGPEATTIEVMQTPHKTEDYQSGDGKYSYSKKSTVIPFYVVESHGLSIVGFNLDGNADQATRDPEVSEHGSIAIFVSGSYDYLVEDVEVHHFATDGLYIGAFEVKSTNDQGETIVIADRNVTIRDVHSHHNARQGMTVAQVNNLLVIDSRFTHSGSTEGSYGGLAPRAGVDIEPVMPVDILTDDLVFQGTSFLDNLGSQIVASSPDRTGLVRLEDCEVTAGEDSYYMMMSINVADAQVVDCDIDTGPHQIYVYPGTEEHPASFSMEECTILSSGCGMISVAKEDDVPKHLSLSILNNEFVGTHQDDLPYHPYLYGQGIFFESNTITLPAKAHPVFHGGSSTYHISSLVQNIELSAGNVWQLEGTLPEGAYFAVGYNTTSAGNTPVDEDHYPDWTYLRPFGAGAPEQCTTSDVVECYSQ